MLDARHMILGTSLRRGVDVALTVGAVVAAGAVIEAAVVPGILIGAAALVVPRLLTQSPRKGRGKSRGADRRSAARRPRVGSQMMAARPLERRRAVALPATLHRNVVADSGRSLRLKEATLKTISFRIIVTVLDFGFNYVVLGDIVTSAGLSAFSFVAGPFFYFLHETSWTYLRPLVPDHWTAEQAPSHYTVLGLRMSHSVAKTITYRLFATASEFSTNLIVVQNLTTAAYLSSFGFFLGPFIYYAHERLWETLDEQAASRALRPTPARIAASA